LKILEWKWEEIGMDFIIGLTHTQAGYDSIWVIVKYVGPFKIIDRKGEVAYQLELPPQLLDIHDVFHVSQLKKCLWIPEEQLPMEELDLGGDLIYSERSIKILDTAERVTRSKVIKMCKVQWSHHTEDEAMWELEEELIADYPELFLSASWISCVRFL
jgi:hypothetical protein